MRGWISNFQKISGIGPKEIELKLEVLPANLPRLAKIPRLRALKTPAKSATEISVYFDTKTAGCTRKD